MAKEAVEIVSASSFVNTHPQLRFLFFSVPEASLFPPLPIWTSSNPRLIVVTCSDGRRISVSVNFHHIPLLSLWLIFSSLPSSIWIHSAYLPVNTDPANFNRWTYLTFHWFSDDRVIILNFVRQTTLFVHDTLNCNMFMGQQDA